jgi:predicted Zn finger-like uncharacterized protein
MPTLSSVITLPVSPFAVINTQKSGYTLLNSGEMRVQITCPNCFTTYRVADDNIGPEGREVRCRQCGHVWRAAPPPAFEVDFSPQPEEPAIEPIMPPMPQPVEHPVTDIPAEENGPREPKLVSEPRRRAQARKPVKPEPVSVLPFKIAFGVLVAGMLAAVLFAYYPSLNAHARFLRPLYSLLGMEDTTKLELFDVSLKKTPKGFEINCAIRNGGAVPVNVPPLQVTLLDTSGGEQARKVLHFQENHSIKPGQSVACPNITIDTKIFDKPLATAILDVGNRFDLSLRK